MFHLLAYQNLGSAAAQTNTDMPGTTDTIVGLRNNHYILTDPFNLGLAYGMGQTLTVVRFNTPSMNAYFRMQIWPLDNPAATPPTVADRPAVADYLSQLIPLPQNEEMALEYSDTAGTAEREAAFLWLFTPDHSLAIPTGIIRMTARATYSITTAAIGAWSGAGTLTFAENLRGGWYSVVGLNVVDPAAWAARLVFPRGATYSGRILRPGSLVQQATGNRPDRRFMGQLGTWGKFHSFEPVQIEIIAGTAAAHTGEVRLDLVYHGATEPKGY